ncbi:MAG: aminotransferase class V-fold PLP-dependent enzyme [Candidatus Peregrinibacteria bacterium]|nr:aminotransferase class V-fold PLP-dependent enzyme [Candidatus Peregrinibacteria bacterium]
MSEVAFTSDADWRKMRYAQEKFCLEAEDLQARPEVLNVLLSCDGDFQFFDEAVRQDDVLCSAALRNAYKKIGRSVSIVEQTEEFKELVEIMRARMGSTLKTVKSFLEDLYPFEVDQQFSESTEEYRLEAEAVIDEEYAQVTADWMESEHALDDAQMANLFRARSQMDDRYLSTYFDSARVGLVNHALKEAVDAWARKKKERWALFKEGMQESIVSSLDGNYSDIGRRRFFPDNCFFQFNGTEAFMLYRRNFMSSGERVLATHEEYSENISELNDSGIRVDSLASHQGEEEFLRNLEEQLMTGKHEYILVSSVGRKGNVYPLEAINEIRKRVSPDTKLIVDACQAAGRRKQDLSACEADAIILSTTKGGDLEQGLGVLVIAGAQPRRETKDLNGSAPAEQLARVAFALNPEAFDLDALNLSDEVRSLVVSPEERGQAVESLAKKFIELAGAINQHHDGRLKILNPVNQEKLAHAIEFKLEGVNRDELCAYLAQYSIYVDAHYLDPTEEGSLRISFHPFMNLKAIRILGGAIVRCLEDYPL